MEEEAQYSNSRLVIGLFLLWVSMPNVSCGVGAKVEGARAEEKGLVKKNAC